MRIQRSWMRSVLAIMGLMISVPAVHAQSYPNPMQFDPGQMSGPPAQAPPGYAMQGPMMGMPPGGPPPGAMMPGGHGQVPYDPAFATAGYQMPPGAYSGQAYGPSSVMPTGYAEAAGMGYSEMGMGMGGEYYGAPAYQDNFDFSIWRKLLPYAPGGCCTQRWYDVQAEFLNLKRDGVSRQVNFTSDGILGPIVLSSDTLGFNEEQGFRAGAAIQLGAGNNLEVSYMGSFNWATQATVTSGTNNLFSSMSQFGFAPFNGFDDTDRSAAQTIEYSSAFDSIEMNYRQRWVGPNCRLQGSWLAGVRFFKMDEDFIYRTSGPANPGFMNYLVGTGNNMTGFQVGGDMWACVVPGLSIGSSAKIGIYGNRAEQATSISANSIQPAQLENAEKNAGAFLAEATVEAIWRLNQNWTFRGGYNLLFVDGVALAIENYNAGPPFVAGQRTVFINDNGNVLYHGLSCGFEWMW